MVAGLPVIATDILFPALGAIYGVACDSVTSLFQAMLDHLESCILQIHEQNSGVLGVDAAMDNDASPYIKSCKRMETICTWLVRTMASQVLIFSIRHASLVRPLLESGKLRMAREHFGAPYQALWAFWPVIFLETSQLGASPLLQDLPPRAYFTFFSPKGQMSCSCPCKGTNLHHYSIHCGWILKGRIKSGEVSRLLWLICCKD
uniref:Uncharacterized protein n=1 Tax=Vitis vinifera TaxID=29760 RepID=F6H5A5_VITVI